MQELGRCEMHYEEWERSVPREITDDPLWAVKANRTVPDTPQTDSALNREEWERFLQDVPLP